MNVTAGKLENINPRTKYIVFGYTRKIQELLPYNNPYYTIPIVIIHIIFFFSDVYE